MFSITILRKWLSVLSPRFVAQSTSVGLEKPLVATRLMPGLRADAGLPRPTNPTLPVRVASSLALAWTQWREKQCCHAELRALDGLSNATRRDLGLAERQNPQLTWSDHDRVRW